MAMGRAVTKFWGGPAACHPQVSWESQADGKRGRASEEAAAGCAGAPGAAGGGALLLLRPPPFPVCCAPVPSGFSALHPPQDPRTSCLSFGAQSRCTLGLGTPRPAVSV